MVTVWGRYIRLCRRHGSGLSQPSLRQTIRSVNLIYQNFQLAEVTDSVNTREAIQRRQPKPAVIFPTTLQFAGSKPIGGNLLS